MAVLYSLDFLPEALPDPFLIIICHPFGRGSRRKERGLYDSLAIAVAMRFPCGIPQR